MADREGWGFALKKKCSAQHIPAEKSVASKATEAWSRLIQGENCETVLQKLFYLHGLALEQVQRYLEFVDSSWHQSSASTYVGERARLQLATCSSADVTLLDIDGDTALVALRQHQR